MQWTNKLANGFVFQEDNYGTIFRQTNPVIDDRTLFSIDRGYCTWNIDAYDVNSIRLALQTALQQREQRMSSVYSLSTGLLELGRILCFSILLTTHDGIAIVESNCFVDESDFPPIDTWFYLEDNFIDNHRPTLFCWIPQEFESVVQEAMRVEMMRSYSWLDEITPVFYSKVLAELREINK